MAANFIWRCTGHKNWLLKPSDKELQAKFAPLAKALTDNEKKIVEELKAVQGKPVDIGGYFMPSRELLDKAMCPSPTFNSIIQAAKA